ncbi:glycerol acyltransferase, partial [Pseudomonas syringae]
SREGVFVTSSRCGWVVAAAILLVVCLGFMASYGSQRGDAASPAKKRNWNIFTQSWATLRMGLGQTPAVSRSIVGNSWFWFVGAIYLTQIPAYAKEGMYGDETVVTRILTVSSSGIAPGSLLCERLLGRQCEVGLVPFGPLRPPT